MPKHPFMSESESDSASEDYAYQFVSQSTSNSLPNISLNLESSSPLPNVRLACESSSESISDENESNSSEKDMAFMHQDWQEDLHYSSDDYDVPKPPTKNNFRQALEELVTTFGATEAASVILENGEISAEITKLLFTRSHSSLKDSLKKSKLSSKKQDRNYLLSLTPEILCTEFHDVSNPAFQLLSHGLFGVTNPADVFGSQHLLNSIALIYSTVSKTINRQATGYALLLTTAARDGGLREDTLRLFPSMVHPRTSQRYDKCVLSVDWDTKLRKCLKEEKVYFEKLIIAEAKIEKLLQEGAHDHDVDTAKEDLERLLDEAPPQVQLVWDNLNLRSKHRFERVGDNYSDTNLDWMASLWIQDRISANHMEHREGVALKAIENLSVKDFIPSETEKDYIFIALVHFFTYRLLQRHPLLFKSLATCIKEFRPHQFQEAMDKKSEEFTGNLFTRSESNTEDLIEMMSEVQLNVHTYKDIAGNEHCCEKKIVSGDNKTEKNMFYGILR